MFKKDYTFTLQAQNQTTIITISEVSHIEYVENTHLMLFFKNGNSSKIECSTEYGSNDVESFKKCCNKIIALFYKYNRY